MQSAYEKRGASSGKEEVHAAIKDLSKGVFPGAFCSLYGDPDGDTGFVTALHADGAGTKSSLAYIKYKETGDLSVFSDLAVDSMTMNIDDLLCVGAVDNFMVSNTIDRNAHRINGDAIKAIIKGYSDYTEFLKSYGINVIMSGGETADVGDLTATLIVNSTFFCRIKKENVINLNNTVPGDVIVGLSSFGKCSYENRYNSGIGSNGLTAARHLLLSHYYAEKYPESFSSTLDRDTAYNGKHKLEDALPGTDITVGEAILSPTRTYAPVIKKLLSDKNAEIHGIVHCTGGGQVKCKNFGKGVTYIKNNLFDIPPLFKLIYESGLISEEEMYKVFNMGHRMELYCPESSAGIIIAAAEEYGIDAKIIGHVENSADGENHAAITGFGGKVFNF